MRRILAVALAIVLCTAVPSSAQVNDESIGADNIEMLPTEEPWLEYTLAVCFLLGALAIGFKTSKRTFD